MLSIFGVLMALASVIFLSYVTTKYFGGKTKKAMKGNYIKIVESVSLGLDKHLHLVKVEDQFVLIATAGKSIEYLTTINVQNFEDKKASEETNPFDFKNFFEKYVQMYKNRTGVKQEKKYEKKGSIDNLENSNERGVFKSNLSKLKDITTRVDYKGKEDGDVDTYEK